MKKRVISVLLIIALLVAVGVVTAQAEATPEQIISNAAAMNFADAPAYCPSCGESQSWTPLTADVAATSSGIKGHYYLTSDLTLTSHITVGSANNVGHVLCIHLNGFTMTGGTASGVFSAREGATLNVYNNNTTGGVTTNASAACLFRGNDNSVVNVYGGTYAMGEGNSNVLVNQDATNIAFNLYGGEVAGTVNCASTNTKSPSVTIDGGSVDTINFGVGTVNITGGTVGEAIIGASATVNLSGAPTVTTLDLTSGAVINELDLTGSASIGVKAGDNAAITANEAAAYVDYFSAEDPYAVTVGDNNKLYYTVDSIAVANGIIEAANAMNFSGTLPTNCPACGATGVTWTALTKPDQWSGHYYLTSDLNMAGHITVGKNNGENLCLHLNGHKLSGGSVGTGGGHYGAFNVRATSNLNVMAGNGGSIVTGGNRLLSNNGNTVVNFYGGSYSATGEAVRMNTANSTVTVSFYSATVTGDVYVKNTGTLNVVNSNIDNVIVENTATAVSVAGATIIGDLDLTSGKLLTVGNLTPGADIAVTGNNGQVFTYELADADAVKNYFRATDASSKIIVQNNALACEGLSWDTPEEIIAEANAMNFDDPNNLPKYCPVCNKASGVEWTAMPTTNTTELSGHYYVENSFDLGGVHYTVGTSAQKDACINLNGKTITGGGSNGVFSMRNCTLNIMGNGSVTGGASASRVFNPNGGTINLYGGTYSVTASTASVVYTKGTGTVTLYAGTINGAVEGSTDSRAVYLTSGATFVMEGGIVTGAPINTDDAFAGTNIVTIKAGAVSGGMLAELCNLTVSGGTINQIDVASNSTVAVSGAPVIDALNLPDDFKITVDELTEGAAITVNANGVFTNELADANAVKGYFTSADPDASVIVEGNALSCKGRSWDTVADKIEAANNMDFSNPVNLPKYCPVCNKASGVEWKELHTDTAVELGGHYYVSGIVEPTGKKADGSPVLNYTVGTSAGNKNACINLNNGTIRGGGGSGIFSMRGVTLNIMGTGNVSGGNSAGRIFNTQGGTINIYGGTYSGTTADFRTVWSAGAGTFNLYGGTLGTTTGTGGKSVFAVYLNSGATFNMEGGTTGRVFSEDNNNTVENTINIKNGAVTGGLGAAMCNLTVSGGTIDRVDVANTSKITLAGDAAISTIVIANGTATPSITVDDSFEGEVMLQNPVLDADPTDDFTTHYGYAIMNGHSKGSFAGNVYATFPTVGDKITYPVYATADGLKIPSTAVVNGETETLYTTTAEAVTAAQNGGYVKLYTNEDVVLADDVIIIDLNGQFVKITGTGTITGFDSATKNFTNGGTAIIDEAITVNTPDQQVEDKMTVGYIKLVDAEAGTTTFNYYAMRIAGIALNPNKAGLYYKATWSVNDNLKDAGASAGVVVSRVAINADFYSKYEEEESYNNLNPDAKKPYTYWFYGYNTANPEAFTNGAVRTSVLVKGILSGNYSEDDNASNADTDIYAKAYIMVGDEIILSEGKNMSILDVLSALDADESLYEANKSGLDLFYTTWKDYLPDNWFDQFNKIGKVA